MATAKVKIGTTLGDAMNFTIGNFAKLFFMAWLPMVFMVALLVSGVFWIMEIDQKSIEELGAIFSGGMLEADPAPDDSAPDTAKQSDAAPGGKAPADEPAPKPAEDDPSSQDAAPPNDPSAEEFEDLQELAELFAVFDPVRLAIALPLMLIGAMILQAVPLVGYTRMQLRGKAPFLWPFYFRLGPTEVRLAVTLFLITILVFVAFFLILLPLMLLGPVLIAANGGESADSAIYAGWVIVAIVLAIFVIVPWLWSRLALAVPICVNEGGLGIARAWRMSSGRGFALTVSFVIGFIVVIVITSFAQIVIELLSLPLSMAANSNSDYEMPIAVAMFFPLMIALIAMQTFQNAFLYGLFTSAYKTLNTETDS